MRIMKKSVVAAIFLVSLLLVSLIASAADLFVTNHSFESGLTGWTQRYGNGGITASTEQNFTGSYSAKILDESSSTSYGIESNFISAAAGSTYMVYAREYISSGNADLYLRFWNSSHTVIGTY